MPTRQIRKLYYGSVSPTKNWETWKRAARLFLLPLKLEELVKPVKPVRSEKRRDFNGHLSRDENLSKNEDRKDFFGPPLFPFDRFWNLNYDGSGGAKRRSDFYFSPQPQPPTPTSTTTTTSTKTRTSLRQTTSTTTTNVTSSRGDNDDDNGNNNHFPSFFDFPTSTMKLDVTTTVSTIFVTKPSQTQPTSEAPNFATSGFSYGANSGSSSNPGKDLKPTTNLNSLMNTNSDSRYPHTTRLSSNQVLGSGAVMQDDSRLQSVGGPYQGSSSGFSNSPAAGASHVRGPGPSNPSPAYGPGVKPEAPTMSGDVLPPAVPASDMNSYPSPFYSNQFFPQVSSTDSGRPSTDTSENPSTSGNPFLSGVKVSQDREDASLEERPKNYGPRDRVRFPPRMPFCPSTCRCRCDAIPKWYFPVLDVLLYHKYCSRSHYKFCSCPSLVLLFSLLIFSAMWLLVANIFPERFLFKWNWSKCCHLSEIMSLQFSKLFLKKVIRSGNEPGLNL